MNTEPKAWLITGSSMFKDAVVQREETADQRIKERGERDNSRKVPLYTAEDLTPPPRTYEQGAGAEEMKSRVYEAIRESLGDAYDCTRVWSAWGYGTMGPDDFALVADDDDRVSEITDAVLRALPTLPEGEGE